MYAPYPNAAHHAWSAGLPHARVGTIFDDALETVSDTWESVKGVGEWAWEAVQNPKNWYRLIAAYVGFWGNAVGILGTGLSALVQLAGPNILAGEKVTLNTLRDEYLWRVKAYGQYKEIESGAADAQTALAAGEQAAIDYAKSVEVLGKQIEQEVKEAVTRCGSTVDRACLERNGITPEVLATKYGKRPDQAALAINFVARRPLYDAVFGYDIKTGKDIADTRAYNISLQPQNWPRESTRDAEILWNQVVGREGSNPTGTNTLRFKSHYRAMLANESQGFKPDGAPNPLSQESDRLTAVKKIAELNGDQHPHLDSAIAAAVARESNQAQLAYAQSDAGRAAGLTLPTPPLRTSTRYATVLPSNPKQGVVSQLFTFALVTSPAWVPLALIPWLRGRL